MTTLAYTNLHSQMLSMKIGDSVSVGSFTVIRVPGGWIWYTSSIATFVPFEGSDK